jgi:hypothetical protein
MTYKRELCEEIGAFFGDFYVDVSGLLVIDNGQEEMTYSSEDELLLDWLPTLEEYDSTTQDGYWDEAITYIRDL